MSEINYYSAAAFTNNVAVARREDVESALAKLRAALAKAEAERDALKARAERLAAECRAWRVRPGHERITTQYSGDGWDEVRYTSAAVDANGDLEAKP